MMPPGRPLHAPTRAELIAATETNYRSYFAAFTILPGMTLWRELTSIVFIANSAPGNSVLATYFDAITVAREIQDLLARLAPLVRRTWWQVLPSCTPTDLAQRLIDAGLESLTEENRPVMTLALDTRPAAPSPLMNLTILRVSDTETMRDWTTASTLGFEASAENNQPYHDAYTALGFDEAASIQHFVGYQSGVPVTSATLLYAGGLAGVYDVSTVPGARRQGLGTAITNACLLDAQERGYHHAVLQASAEGLPVYQRLGFSELYREQNFEWHCITS